MRISSETWRKYQRAHAMLQGSAKRELEEYFDTLPWDVDEDGSLRLLCLRAIALVQRYGLADSELSAQFYDELMAMQGATLEPAEVLDADTRFVARDVTEAVGRGSSSVTAKALAASVVSGHVKRAGIETVDRAVSRDGAMWAWVCIGDTCAFCRTLGSKGWQHASKSLAAGNHADHIHDNCDCQLVVKPDGASLDVEGYEPDALYAEYRDMDGKNSKDKINAMRRADYSPEYAEQRNARRRELYAQAHPKEETE